MTKRTNLNWLKGLLAAMALCATALFSPLAAMADDGLATKIANREQLTNVPTIYLTIPLDDIAGGVDQYGKEHDADGNDLYRRATIEVVDASGALETFTDDGLSIKVRGNSTAAPGNGKYAYRLKFDKDVKENGVVVSSHKHDLLGSGYKKRNWTLLANAFDNSMLRNALTYHLGQYVGMPFCPGYKFVDVVINGSYRGTYQVSDHVEVGSHRVDINEDEDWFLEGVTWTTQTEEPYAGNGEPYMCIKNPEPKTAEAVEALKQEVSAWREQWLASFNNGTFDKWNDMESLVRFYVAINITGDIDSWFVFKGYRTPTGPFTWGPLWDKDLAYGNYGEASATKMVENYNKCNFEQNIQALQTNAKFMKAVKAKMDELVTSGLADKLAEDIDRMAAEIDQTQQLNFQKYNIGSEENGCLAFPTYGQYVNQLKEWVADRISFVQQQVNTMVENLPKPVDATYNPANPWWYTQLSTRKNYNLTIENGHALKAGEWNTFCLPFDADEAKMVAALGCTYELREHSGMAADGQTMLFTAPKSKDIEAGVPYLIKPGQDVATYGTFEDVVYSVNVNHQNNPYNGEGVTFDGEHYFYASLFHGYEVSTTTDYLFPNDIWAEGQTLAKATSDHPHDGMRCFVRTKDGSLPTMAIAETTTVTGDVNGDGTVSVADVTAIVNYILGKQPEAFDAVAADANGDGAVTVADVTTLVNLLLGKGEVWSVK